MNELIVWPCWFAKDDLERRWSLCAKEARRRVRDQSGSSRKSFGPPTSTLPSQANLLRQTLVLLEGPSLLYLSDSGPPNSKRSLVLCSPNETQTCELNSPSSLLPFRLCLGLISLQSSRYFSRPITFLSLFSPPNSACDTPSSSQVSLSFPRLLTSSSSSFLPPLLRVHLLLPSFPLMQVPPDLENLPSATRSSPTLSR